MKKKSLSKKLFQKLRQINEDVKSGRNFWNLHKENLDRLRELEIQAKRKKLE